MADHHDRRIKDLISNRDFAISFMQQYMASELVALVDWATFELDTASVEHVRQQHKNNVKQKELSDLAFSFNSETVEMAQRWFILNTKQVTI